MKLGVGVVAVSTGALDFCFNKFADSGVASALAFDRVSGEEAVTSDNFEGAFVAVSGEKYDVPDEDDESPKG